MLALISPSKTLDFESNFEIKNATQPFFKKEILELIEILRTKSQKDISKLMDLSEKLAKLNYDRYQSFSDKFTVKNSKSAIFAFKGDVYEGLDIETLNPKQQDIINNKVAILSGLYGLLKPYDLIQPYRLEMGIGLKNINGKNLYDFWGNKITDKINEIENKLLINLASQEYFKAVKIKKINAKLINIDFKENKNGKLSTIGIFAKRARGLMTRFIALNNINDEKTLKEFNLEKYKFNKELSSENNFIFVR